MFGRRIAIGLDIGNHSVKAAILGDNRKEILDLLEMEIMPERQYIEEIPGDVLIIESIKKTLEKYMDPKSRYRPGITVSFQGEGAICSYLELPRLKKEEQALAIQSAAAKILPFSLNEAVTTYIPVTPLSEGLQTVGTFFIGFRKNLLDRQQDLLRRSGIAVDHYEAYVHPLVKAFAANHGKGTREFIAIVSTGSRLTTVIVVKNGNPYYMRDFAAAGYQFTYAFQMGNQSSWKDAEAYKRAYDATRREVPLEPPLTKWLEQVKKSLDAFQRQFRKQDPSIAQVYLTGGTSAFKGLDIRLGEFLKLPVSAERWEQITHAGNQITVTPGSFSVALGLAL